MITFPQVRGLWGVGRPVGRVVLLVITMIDLATTVAGCCATTLMLGRAALERIRLILLRVGFASCGPGRPAHWLSSAPPFHPYRPVKPGARRSRGTVPRVSPGGCWPPPCPVEPGPSSTHHPEVTDRRPPGQPTSCPEPGLGAEHLGAIRGDEEGVLELRGAGRCCRSPTTVQPSRMPRSGCARG